MQGVGQTMLPFGIGVAGVWSVRIVGTFLCTQIFGMGLVSAWVCMIANNLLIFLLLTACYCTGRRKPKK